MKLKIIFTTLFLAVSCMVNAAPAHAVIEPTPSFNTQINFSLLGANPGGEMGIGQSGTLDFGSFMFPGNGIIDYALDAIIPTGSKITFSYNSTGFVSGEGLAGASASPVGGILFAEVDAAGEGLLFNEASSALAYVSTQFVGGDSSSAQMVIKNLSDSSLSIMSHLEQLYAAGSLAGMTVTYDVSAVPLPAALPMFGLGLLAMVGIRRRKSAQEAAA